MSMTVYVSIVNLELMKKWVNELMEIFKYIKPAQDKLFRILKQSFRESICKTGKYILVKGEAPVMLVAHLDTVHKQPVTTICISEDRNILMSPQGIGGDDRCGVYALCSVYKEAKRKPWLLFTCDEEVGCIGAVDFARDYAKDRLPDELSQLKMLIEVDRKGNNDAVYYECCNIDFEEYISSKGFITAQGSVSDISFIAPELGVAAVNLSSGYYNAHTSHEYIDLASLDATIVKIREIVEESTSEEIPRFIYESMCDWHYWYYGCSEHYSREQNIFSRLNKKQKAIYNELLDRYDEDELNMYIADYGAEVLKEIYEEEFGTEGEDNSSDELPV